MFDPIRPPAARRPEEALELVSQALSDGDLEAALAQYEKGALLACWPGAGEAGQAGEVGQVLGGVMALRLPLYVRISSVLESSELALVICERRVDGTGPDGERVWFLGHGCAVLRPQPDGAWRIAADAWRVETELPPDPPEIPPGIAGDPVPGEGQGGQPHH
jgi:ketosteroid isomerase-like protein